MTPANEFPGNVFFFVFLVGFLAFFAWSAATRASWFFKSKPVNRLDHLFWRMAGMGPLLVGNQRVATNPRYKYSGILHTLIWWGFIVLQIRTLNFLLNGIDHSISFEANLGIIYDLLRPLMDTFNLLVLLGCAMAAVQRAFVRPHRMTLNMDGWIILFFIAWLMVTDVFLNSLEFYLHPNEFDHKQWAYLTYSLYKFWDVIGLSSGMAKAMNVFFFYNHLIDFLAFLCYLPYSKHSHVLTVAPQIMFRRFQPTGTLSPIPDIETAESFGVG
ncbi:MAG: hypothetical protein ABI559_03400, partial [Chloroflexota bacterium]